MPKLIKDIVKKAIKKDTVNLAKALTSQKALAAQKIAAQKRPMGLKVDSTKKVTPIGSSKPSVMIKKQTTVKPAKPGVISGPYRPNPESKNKPQVKTLPSKIEYKKDKFGKNQIVKPSNPLMKLKNKY